MVEALDIQVKGIVQGVGFRPFVYRLAKEYLINGWVLNAVDSVRIHAEGESNLLDEFVLELSDSANAPAAASVSEIELHEVPLEGCDSFEIRFSDENSTGQITLISPDLATCDDCVHELFDPEDRRFRYPFINCTNCGPRFTIIEELPYDRAKTSMRAFTMCDDCAAEYDDPANRRFHAQPNACFDCGPQVSWRARTTGTENVSRETFSDEAQFGEVLWGTTREESNAIFAQAVELLLAGRIVAVKGLGGFHLVCDACNSQAVESLRTRKRRKGKAFAVMMADVDAARSVCFVNEVEASVLESPQRPIVLLRKRADVSLPSHVADGLSELGIMLPCTPVQHLLMHDFAQAADTQDVPMLVMTSGNLHDDPIVIDDDEAYAKLGSIADAFVGNNRAILTRFDDSVVRVIEAGSAGNAVQFIRRARGYAPLPIDVSKVISASDMCDPNVSRETLGSAKGADKEVQCAKHPQNVSRETLGSLAPALFATGSEQKNTFTMLRGAETFVSQHIGDMENAETFDAWLDAKKRYEQLFKVNSQTIACDMHPEYLTSKWAHRLTGADASLVAPEGDASFTDSCHSDAEPAPIMPDASSPSAPERESTSAASAEKVPIVEVQHHHAHVVSAMAEHGLQDAVCGIAFDGTGYGVDGAIWGGEVLLANLRDFERFANFVYVPMPGGAASINHPLRMAYGVLWAYDLLDHPAAQSLLTALGEQADVCETMIENGVNTPMTSSVGRLFDAASALLGICTEPHYEGEGAVLLEGCMCDAVYADAAFGEENVSRETFDMSDKTAQRYAIDVIKNSATDASTAQDTSVVLLDPQSTFCALLDDLAAGIPVPAIARCFHNAFVDAILAVAELERALYGIDTIVLSGGVFMNRYLIEHVVVSLETCGFTVVVNRDLPPNDGCVSLGQAVIAWAKTTGEG